MSHLEDSITAMKIVWQLYGSGISPEIIAGKVGKHRSTIYRWLSSMKKRGLVWTIERHRAAKKGHRHRKTKPSIKNHVYAVRKRYRQCCGEKIQYFLKQDYDESLSVSTIYRILNERYELRSKWKKNIKRGPVFRGEKPREVIQVDTVDFGAIYAFTAIDTYTKEPSVILKTSLTGQSGAEALNEQMRFFGHVEKIQRDGGPEFKAEWSEAARHYTQHVRTSRPYKKNEQAFIERFNGILRKECLGYGHYRAKDLPQLQEKLNEFLQYYLYVRPHLSLEMQTPHAFAMSHLT